MKFEIRSYLKGQNIDHDSAALKPTSGREARDKKNYAE